MARKRRREANSVLEANPTVERFRRAGEDVQIGDDKGGRKTLRVMDAPLEQAVHRAYITEPQYWAGYRMRQHWYLGGLSGGASAIDYGRVFCSDFSGFSHMPKTEVEWHHRSEWRNVCTHLGSIDAHFLESVVCRDVPLIAAGHGLGYGGRTSALKQAKLKLKAALSSLINFWG